MSIVDSYFCRQMTRYIYAVYSFGNSILASNNRHQLLNKLHYFAVTTIHCPSETFADPKNNERHFLRRKGGGHNKGQSVEQNGRVSRAYHSSNDACRHIRRSFFVVDNYQGGWTFLFFFFFLKDAPRGSLPYVCTEADHPGAP